MNKSLTIDQQIEHMLRQMRKAMPEVKRQVKVYEKSLDAGMARKTKKATPLKNA